MRASLAASRRRLAAPLAALTAVVIVFSSAPTRAGATLGACPPGTVRAGSEQGIGAARDPRLAAALNDLERRLATPRPCVPVKHPESFSEISARNEQLAAIEAAPFASVPAGLYRAALEQRAAMIAAAPAVSGADGRWEPAGTTPLISNDSRFTSVNGLGWAKLNGRVDSIDYDPVGKRLFALIGTGGVWTSTDLAKTWTSIGEGLPTQINGALAWTPASGGTLAVVSGEALMAYGARTGLGAFYTRDLGQTWHQARGIPDGALGFRVAVDFSKPNVLYAATSKGLYRSDDAGASYVNVSLPTGECAGKTDNGRCILANMVTDVTVQVPGGTTNAPGGKVMAVVGYRAGNRKFAQDPDLAEGPWNGLYRSDTGAPGTFQALPGTGFAPQPRIGRTEFGAAEGPAQNHDYVYAIVQDAIMFQGGTPTIDAPEELWTGVNTTMLNGIYVSADFGSTWTVMADTAQIAYNPTSGSALQGPIALAGLFTPGAQAWYNQWIKPDPTKADANGVPTRLLFGLEEVWQNEVEDQPQSGRSAFKVIGRYFGGDACLFLDTGLPYCPTNRPPGASTTTHPDQHSVEFVPDDAGGVTVIAGNDGGVYSQHAAQDEEFENTKWGDGANDGFNTLLPYHARIAKDGKIWFGLQDNGSGFIDPANGKQFMAFGGDGFYVQVDPEDSNIAWSETPGGSMRVTTDGGVNWSGQAPDISAGQFSNPFAMDQTDGKHLMTAGPEVFETVNGANTCSSVGNPDVATVTLSCTWEQVFHLGTNERPGQAPPPDTDPLAKYPGVPQSLSAIDLRGDAAYLASCGPCSVMNSDVPFYRSIATNVGGSKPPKKMTSDGWHIAAAKNLPNRTVTSITIDPRDANTVYVSLGGYDRDWRPPGSFGDKNPNIGRGSVWKSSDAGATFVDVSGNLPNAPANWVDVRNDQLVVGTNAGAFLSKDLNGTVWAALGNGLPNVPVSSVQVKPGDPNTIIASTFGRGVYIYRFPTAPAPPKPPAKPAAKPRTVVGGTKRNLPSTGADGWATGALLAAIAATSGWRVRRRPTLD